MPLIAVDWGTSSLRAARLDDGGTVLEERSHPRGILTVERGDFPAVFDALFGDWMREPGTRCLIAGMAGSRQGWVEATYRPCPSGLADLGAALTWIEPGRIAIVPGLQDERDGVPDVMRGEEVQIFGALALGGVSEGVFVLPGTHSKWALVEDGRVTGFRTFMTGEFYALLSRHSILARTLDADAALDEAAFLRGVARAADTLGLLHHAFGCRSLPLFERMAPAQAASYLSGLVIGEELRCAAPPPGSRLVLVGAAALTRRYALALEASGVGTQALGAEASWAGLHALAGDAQVDRAGRATHDAHDALAARSRGHDQDRP